MPVLFSRLEPDNVSRANLLDWPAFALRPTRPKVTMSVCPSGWVCHAVRAPGSKVTALPAARAGALAANSGSIRTLPVNQLPGPFVEDREPLGEIFTSLSLSRPSAEGQKY